MRDATNIFEIPVNENGEINSDLVCRRCGYNLRGLREAGRCPECGTAIGLSTRGDLLRFADPTWVEKLALGMKYILWGIVVSIAISVLGGCLVRFAASPQALQAAFAILGSLLGLYGAWLLTSPDPSRVGEDKYITARKVVRIGLMFGVASQLLTFVVQGFTSASTTVAVLLVIADVAFGLVSVAGEFAKFLYLQKLAERIPDPKLAGSARFLRWAFSIGLGCMVIFGGLMFLAARSAASAAPPFAGPNAPTSAMSSAGPNTPAATPAAPGAGGAVTSATSPSATAATRTIPISPGATGVLVAGGCVFAVAMLVFGIMALVLYIRIGKRFREQADIARLTWAAGAGATPDIPPTE